MEVHSIHWIAFSVFVAVMLTLDLLVFHRKAKEPTLKESAWWTVFWCGLAVAFAGWIRHEWGNDRALEFVSGYLIEWSLSMDNVFVFAVIFSYFRVPLKYQYRVLFWGILGAIFMRLAFIAAGAAILHYAEWIMPIFGAFLIYTGVKLLKEEDDDFHPDQNILMRWGRKIFRVSKEAHGNHFFAREEGKLCVTPLFLVLLVIESTDLLFAVDSVPAIFGVTKFPYIVFTSNIFAIMGLRALYFLLAGVMDMFRYLNYGLSAVLIFVGAKMGIEYFAHTDLCEKWFGSRLHEGDKLISPFWSLVVVMSLLGISIIASLIAAKREGSNVPGSHPPEEPGLTPPPPVPDNAEPVLPPDPEVDEPNKS